MGILAPLAFTLLKDYLRQKKKGIKEPVFHKSILTKEKQEGVTLWD